MTIAPFRRVAIIGLGLIGSSLARALTEQGLADHIVGGDADPAVCQEAVSLGVVAEGFTSLADAVVGADLVVLSVPVGANAAVAATIGPALADGAIVTDVGSVKQAVIDAVKPHLPSGVQFVPGHPIAGTEHSGPAAGFASLFDGRYWILTPETDTDPAAVERLTAALTKCGAMVETMAPAHHDRVLAITSHLPHLIAYTIVGTATDLQDETKDEVIRYSASGFRDFTRIAASDPVMWRDVFLNNREAVLEILQRFSEDLTALQRAIRWGEGDTLQRRFEETRDIRRGVIDANQA
ncbi:MAG: prephenate/arogenate dehydrogenase family protein [Pseudomonadota bacterium]